jgi:hypothetical protein
MQSHQQILKLLCILLSGGHVFFPSLPAQNWDIYFILQDELEMSFLETEKGVDLDPTDPVQSSESL